jgi:hypothetical protein
MNAKDEVLDAGQLDLPLVERAKGPCCTCKKPIKATGWFLVSEPQETRGVYHAVPMCMPPIWDTAELCPVTPIPYIKFSITVGEEDGPDPRR